MVSLGRSICHAMSSRGVKSTSVAEANLEGDGGIGGVDLLEAGLDDVVAQPHDERVRLVRLERRPVLLRKHSKYPCIFDSKYPCVVSQ